MDMRVEYDLRDTTQGGLDLTEVRRLGLDLERGDRTDVRLDKRELGTLILNLFDQIDELKRELREAQRIKADAPHD